MVRGSSVTRVHQHRCFSKMMRVEGHAAGFRNRLWRAWN